jgi:hypothetical protein
MRTISKLIIAGLTAAAFVSAAHAETYLYACHYEGDAHLYSATLNTTNKTITWRGKANDARNSVYSNMKVTSGKGDCAKECFEATRKDGAGIKLSTATQGVASLTALVGTAPGADGIDEVDCDLVLK